MPVTTAVQLIEAHSIMRRAKIYARSTILTERLSSLAGLHCYKHWEIDTEKVIAVDYFVVTKKKTSLRVPICNSRLYR